MASPLRLLVADQTTRVLAYQGLGSATPALELCGIASNGNDLLEECRLLIPDVIVVNEPFLGMDLGFVVPEVLQIVPHAIVIELVADPATAQSRHRVLGSHVFLPVG